jgi:prolyl-tRNA editing enzyme YbaK/EbsC (Cys-tRNA(Pro) deacylase)
VQLDVTTHSAQDAALAIGCKVEQIAKSLIFRGEHTSQPILVIASGRNRVDEAKLSALVGEPVAKADADFVRERTGFVIGGVPPVGHSEPMTTFLDQDLYELQLIWAAAGTPHVVFRLTPSDLGTLTGGQIVAVT